MKDIKANYKITLPRIPKKLDEFQCFNNNIQNDDSFCMKMISDCSIENQRAEHVDFKQMIFRNVTFRDVSFKGIDLTDVRFENCDLSNGDLSGAIVHRVEMINCKILGIDLSEATMQNVIFDNCDGRYAFFRFSYCKQVNFKDCILNNADFQESNFTKVGFFHSNLQQSQMSGTKLQGMDFSNCEIEGIGLRIEDIYGAIFSPMQALTLSNLLGIIINYE